MKPDYTDIRLRLGEPLWYDRHGVPRYDAFQPEMCGVYAQYVVYLEVACQACGRRFRVASEWDSDDGLFAYLLAAARNGVNAVKGRDIGPTLPSAEHALGSFDYGDPPRHGGGGCFSGDTMTSDPVRVIEFWRCDGADRRWRRDAEYEVAWDDAAREAGR